METQVTDLLTLHLDAASQEHFEGLRQRYFPPELNRVPAHLSLFHTLPREPEIGDMLAATAANRTAFDMQVTGLRSLGRGVAYVVTSPELLALHRGLAAEFAPHLSRQDSQKFMPHVVIQNKATPEKARDLIAILQPAFRSFSVRAEGLDLWHYLAGPWELAKTFPFQG